MASSNESYTKQLQEFVTCTTYLDHYQDSRRPSCSNTSFATNNENSIQHHLSTSPSQEDVKIEQNDVTNVSIDRISKHMVEFLTSINLSNNKNLNQPCNNCDQNQAINWCDKCDSYYCESCATSIHSNKALQSHTIIPSAEKILSFCTNHLEEKLKYWCKKCKILVCRDCLLYEHKYHIYSSLNDATTEAKTKFQETVQEVDQIRRNLGTFSETTKDITNQQREVFRQGKHEIEQTFNNLQCLLEERKSTILKQLEDNSLQTMNILERQRNIIYQLLNLAIVQENCIQKMLDSNDPIQVLKFKSTLHQNYDDFVELYNRIDDGYIIKRYLFKKDEKDIEQISGIISRLGHINSTSWMIQGDSVTVKTSSIDISRVVGNTGLVTKENNCARGYKLILKKSLKLRSFQIHSDHIGQIIGFVVNDIGTIIQKSTIYSANSTMKWLSIPMECDLQNNYSVLVLTTSNNGSYSYKNGDDQIRIINQHCAVESKYIHSIIQINVDLKVNIENHIYSIDMVLRVEE